MKIALLLVLVLSVSACSRLSDSFGAGPAKGARGPAMENVANPAGLKVPAHAVTGEPSQGFWNCGEYPQTPLAIHDARCTLNYEGAPEAGDVNSNSNSNQGLHAQRPVTHADMHQNTSNRHYDHPQPGTYHETYQGTDNRTFHGVHHCTNNGSQRPNEPGYCHGEAH